jgi:purine-binding chemotaxis protein CheW
VELITVGADAVERAAGGIPNAPYVAGVARLPDGLLVIYDLERFLSLDEAAELEAALKTRP